MVCYPSYFPRQQVKLLTDGRNETLTFTVGPETPSFTATVLGMYISVPTSTTPT